MIFENAHRALAELVQIHDESRTDFAQSSLQFDGMTLVFVRNIHFLYYV